MRVEDLDHNELLELDPDGGIIRFSVPHRPWRQGELDLIRWALWQSTRIEPSNPTTCGTKIMSSPATL